MPTDAKRLTTDAGGSTTTPRRLSKQILLTYGVILLAVSLAFGVFLVLNTHREWRDNAGAFARYLARAVALDASESLLANDEARLMEKLQSIGHADLVSLTCIYDRTRLVAAFAKAAAESAAARCPPTQDDGIHRTLHALETVYSGDTPIGYVTVHIDDAVVDARTLRRVAPVLAALLVTVLLVLVATHISNRRAIRGLTRLTEYARSTAAETTEFPRINDAPAEVVELAEAFRRLVHHLLSAREEASREAESRRLAQGAEQSSRRLLRDIVDNVQHAIIVRRSDGSLLFVNPAAASLYGVSVEMMNQPEFMAAQRRPDGLLITTGEGHQPREVEFTGTDGVPRRLFVSHNRIEGTDYELTLAFDITEVHRLQSQLQYAQRLETVGTLAGGIAHDFNNLLTPILGYSTLLESMDLSEDVRTRLAHITSAATRARGVVQQILTFSRRRPPLRTRVAIRGLIEDTVSLMRATIPGHIGVFVDAIDDAIVDADPGQIEQVLVNLITNASQAIGEHPGEIHIHSGLDGLGENGKPAPHVAIRIADTGPGMTAEVMSHIFEPFFTTKGVGEGSGLGLAVVHGIIRNHDGRIDVQSVPGRGTTFTILLPAAEPLSSPASIPGRPVAI